MKKINVALNKLLWNVHSDESYNGLVTFYGMMIVAVFVTSYATYVNLLVK